MHCTFNTRAKENSNRGEIAFCYKFMLTKGKKPLLNKTTEEKKLKQKEKNTLQELKKKKSDRGLLGKLDWG